MKHNIHIYIKTAALAASLALASCMNTHDMVYGGRRASVWRPYGNDEATIAVKVDDIGITHVEVVSGHRLDALDSEHSTTIAQPTGDVVQPEADETYESGSLQLEYTDGDAYSGHLDATARDELTILYSLLSAARNGRTVTLAPSATADVADTATADTLTLTTTNVEQVIPWTRRMVRQGYAVTIDYNPDTGTYRCVAVLKKRRNNR